MRVLVDSLIDRSIDRSTGGYNHTAPNTPTHRVVGQVVHLLLDLAGQRRPHELAPDLFLGLCS